MNFGEAMYVVLRGGIVYRTQGNFEDSGLPSQRIRLDETMSMIEEFYMPELTISEDGYFNMHYFYPTKDDLNSSYTQVYHG